MIYTTGQWSVAYALDARTGKILWTFDPQVSRANVRTICCDIVNRGVALYEGKVYLGTLDGRLIALDANPESLCGIWSPSINPNPTPLRALPHREGNGSHRQCGRGTLACAAISPPTTRTQENWCGAPTPSPVTPQRASRPKRWKTRRKPGTGRIGLRVEEAPFGTPSSITQTRPGLRRYRQRKHLVPRSAQSRRRRQSLASILALRASDGQLVWHYQVTPQENWDYDATQPLMLADLNIGGTRRKVIMQAFEEADSSECLIAKPASFFPRNRLSTESTGQLGLILGADGRNRCPGRV